MDMPTFLKQPEVYPSEKPVSRNWLGGFYDLRQINNG